VYLAGAVRYSAATVSNVAEEERPSPWQHHPTRLADGTIGLVSQSGALMVSIEEIAELEVDLVAEQHPVAEADPVGGCAVDIVGAGRDPYFGAVVLVGLGGIAVGILRDVALAPAPVSPARAGALIASLRGAPLLTDARGRPPVDVPAIADAVSRISRRAADLGPRLGDLEVNPCIVRRPGEGALAVDGRATLNSKEEPGP
jgi:acetyl-CoA synthetase (ADP-forming)